MWALTVAVLYLSMTSGHAEDYDERDLTNKTVVITGAARGIGRAIAENFLDNNVKIVIIVDKNETQGEKTTSELNSIYGDGKVVFYPNDITVGYESVIADILEKFVYVDVLVNNAGVLDEYNLEYTFQVNIHGTVTWALKFYESMNKLNGGKGGTIINISSMAGYLRYPFMVLYQTSKTAALGFTFGLGHEFTHKSTGVRVTAICPGLTNTELIKGQLVIDEQVEIYKKFESTWVPQEPNHVGKCAVDIFKNANTGTAWTVEANKEAYEAPARLDITASALEAL